VTRDDPVQPEFLGKETLLAIHADQLRQHGGLPGIRDEGLLDSAIAQPSLKFGGGFLHAGLLDMAAAYLFHLAMNHPFVDGNKRTALAACLVFLELNGFRVREEETDLADMVLELIERRRTKAWVARQLRQRTERIGDT
jgi:death-on-curing protein